MRKFKINLYTFQMLCKRHREELENNGFKAENTELRILQVPIYAKPKDFDLKDLEIGEGFSILKIKNQMSMQSHIHEFKLKTGRVITLNAKLSMIIRIS